jgi:hypothetical protein
MGAEAERATVKPQEQKRSVVFQCNSRFYGALLFHPQRKGNQLMTTDTAILRSSTSWPSLLQA